MNPFVMDTKTYYIGFVVVFILLKLLFAEMIVFFISLGISILALFFATLYAGRRTYTSADLRAMRPAPYNPSAKSADNIKGVSPMSEETLSKAIVKRIEADLRHLEDALLDNEKAWKKDFARMQENYYAARCVKLEKEITKARYYLSGKS